MEHINKKECPNCNSSDVRVISKIDVGDAIITKNPNDYPKLNKTFYYCICNKCREQFEFYPDENS